MAQSKSPLKPQPTWPKTILTGLAIVGCITLISYLATRDGRSPVQSTTGAPKASATPTAYSDTTGKVVSIDSDSINVTFTGTSSSGDSFEKNFRVATSSTTDFKKISLNNGQRTYTAMQRNDIKVGDTIYIANSENIAPLTEFTATKVYLYTY